MSTHQNWAEALNISPETLATWSAQAPSGTPLLVWCLEQGHIQLETYFTWAQTAYEVPILDTRYFREALDNVFVTQARNHGNWYPWQFPIEKWDDVTLVACVEVPPQEEWGEYRFVLADPRAMREAWGTTGMHKVEDQPPAPPSAESLEAPIGISATPKPFKLDLNLDGAMEFPSEPPTAVDSKPPKPELIQELPAEGSIHIDQSSLFQEPTRIAPVVAMTPPAPAPAAAPASTSKRDAHSSELTAIKDLFANLGQRYHGSLILKCSETNAQLKHWDHRLKVSPSHPSLNMNLSYPTFLRIVAKTMMPYHGYLMDSSAHRDFFQALGFDGLPSCVTAVPIKDDGNLWGIVVAIGNEENQKMDSLSFVQEHTDKLIAAIGDEWLKVS